MSSISTQFTWERDTKNKSRFNEDGEDHEQVVGSLYVSKEAVSELGKPSKLIVTIEAVEDES